MRPTSTTSRAFSLVEVVIAIGIFAGAIATILALFGPLSRAASEVSRARQAARLAEAINVELVRLRDAFPSSATQTKNDQFAALFVNNGSLTLVGSTDGTRVVREADAGNAIDGDLASGTVRGVAASDRPFLIRIVAQSASTPGQTPFLALTAAVEWPYQISDGNGGFIVTRPADRRTLLLNYALAP